jgi:hypothetical protein
LKGLFSASAKKLSSILPVLSIGFLSVSNQHDFDVLLVIIDFINDAIITHPDSPIALRTAYLPASGRGLGVSASDWICLIMRLKSSRGSFFIARSVAFST